MNSEERTASFALNVHGLGIECRAEERFTTAMRRPFLSFLSPATQPTVVLRVIAERPRYDQLPDIPMSFVTPRNAVFVHEGRKIIDYGGRALLIEDVPFESYRLVCDDPSLAQHIFHLFVLALSGRYADRRGWLKFHALAVERAGRAFMVTMPSGGGKSTLLVELLRRGVTLVSEDVCYIDEKGRALPFPFPVGVKDRADVADVPDERIWIERRLEGGDKPRVDLSAFSQPPASGPIDRWVLITGVRLLNGEPAFRRLGFRASLRILLRDSVVGVGVYQGLEFLLTRPASDLFGLIPTILRRLALALRLVWRAPCSEFRLSRDARANADAFIKFMETFERPDRG